jgi:hypothetical protein
MSKHQTSPHYHRYERQLWPSGKAFYKCMLPGCPHYLPLATLAVGRESLCWGTECNHLVIITREDVTREVRKPMCSDCKEARKQRKEELSKIG